MAPRKYILTDTAEKNFLEAKQWSKTRWGSKRTLSYFKAVEACANRLSDRCFSLPSSEKLTSSSDLYVWPVNEHYLIYLPIRKGLIVIVAFIRQTRDVPSILAANTFLIEREVKAIFELIRTSKLRLE